MDEVSKGNYSPDLTNTAKLYALAESLATTGNLPLIGNRLDKTYKYGYCLKLLSACLIR